MEMRPKAAVPLWFVVLYLLTDHCLPADSEACSPCSCYSESFGIDGSNSLHKADCSGLGIAGDDELALPSNIEYLDLSDNKLSRFPCLSGLINLTHVNLQNNHITDLCEVQSCFENLVYVDLISNNLTTRCLGFSSALRTLKLQTDHLDDDIFQNISFIKDLHLVTSQPSIPERLFQTFNSLEKLYIHIKNCSWLPEGLLGGSNLSQSLKKLVINGPNLVIQNRSLLMNVVHLEHVHLIFEDLEALPSDVLYEEESACDTCHVNNRYYLRSVTIEGVRKIPSDMLRYATALERLKIVGSKDIPEDFIISSSLLSEIVLSNCSLKFLPKRLFSESKEVKKVNLSNNALRSVEELKQLEQLKYLDLSGNEINSFPGDTLQAFSATIRCLNLFDNPMCDVRPDTLSGLVNLQQLDIDLTCVDKIEPGLFSDLSRVENATIRVKNTSAVQQDAFLQMTSLIDLRLNDLQLVGLKDEQFDSLLAQSEPAQLSELMPTSGILPPRSNRTYCIVHSGEGQCRCEEGVYQLTVMDKMNGSALKAFCLHKDHLPFEVGVRCLDSNTSVSVKEDSPADAQKPNFKPFNKSRTHSAGSPSALQRRPNGGTSPQKKRPQTPSPIALLTGNIQYSKKTLQTSTSPLPPTRPPRVRIISTLLRLFTPATLSTSYVKIATKTPAPKLKTAVYRTTERTVTTTVDPGQTNRTYIVYAVKWAVPTGIILLLFVVIVPAGWAYHDSKRRERILREYMQQKRSPARASGRRRNQSARSELGKVATKQQDTGPFDRSASLRTSGDGSGGDYSKQPWNAYVCPPYDGGRNVAVGWMIPDTNPAQGHHPPAGTLNTISQSADALSTGHVQTDASRYVFNAKVPGRQPSTTDDLHEATPYRIPRVIVKY